MADYGISSKWLTLVGALFLLSALAQSALAQSTTAAPANDEANKQAAYCMEASFGLLQQTTKFIAVLKQNRDQGQMFLKEQAMSPPERAQIAAILKRMDDDIVVNEKSRADREADLKVFMAYLERNGLLNMRNKPELILQMSGEVRKDQQEMQTTYTGCLRGCAPNDASCKKTCDDKANGSEASKRMNRCSEVAGRFKG